MSFFHGVGRFARARGSSMFARRLNGELPRGLAAAVGGQSIRFFGELPLTGYAEQFRTVNAAGFAQLSNDDAVGGIIEGTAISQDEALQLAALATGDITFFLSQWSGLLVCREECVSKVYIRRRQAHP